MNSKSAKQPIQILQITDTHLYGVREGTLLKLNTHDSLAMVLDTVEKNEPHIDLILATGDIAQDGSEAAYRHFIHYMERLKAPFRWIPGNHDIPAVMESVARSSETAQDAGRKIEQIGNWIIIMLDSSRLGHVHGFLDRSEMSFLQTTLSEMQANNTAEHCLVCLHHNPIPGSAGWMKDIGLRNDREFLELVSKFDRVRGVVYGHIHQELDFMFNNIRLFCTPSTCIQFKPEVIDFALDNLNPGYRRLQLHADGSIESEVIRAEGQALKADFSSAGY
ncbi:MAG: hypothetical protein RLZZ385_422 [Pseudomonadota bacterium]|jgi:Icc protein